MSLLPLTKKRATDEVYDSLRAAILTRLFRPGQRLLADELSEQLGVSLTPIRHALQQLAVEGLVEIHPRSGTFVASISANDLAETFEIRLALELLAAQRAVTRLSPEQHLDLKKILVALSQPVTDEVSLKRHESLNLDFHRALFQISASKRLSDLYETLNAHIQIARIHATEDVHFPSLRARLTQEHIEHQAIVDALALRSLSQLEAAVRNHILRARESLMSALDAALAERPANERAKHQKA